MGTHSPGGSKPGMVRYRLGPRRCARWERSTVPCTRLLPARHRRLGRPGAPALGCGDLLAPVAGYRHCDRAAGRQARTPGGAGGPGLDRRHLRHGQPGHESVLRRPRPDRVEADLSQARRRRSRAGSPAAAPLPLAWWPSRASGLPRLVSSPGEDGSPIGALRGAHSLRVMTVPSGPAKASLRPAAPALFLTWHVGSQPLQETDRARAAGPQSLPQRPAAAAHQACVRSAAPSGHRQRRLGRGCGSRTSRSSEPRPRSAHCRRCRAFTQSG